MQFTGNSAIIPDGNLYLHTDEDGSQSKVSLLSKANIKLTKPATSEQLYGLLEAESFTPNCNAIKIMKCLINYAEQRDKGTLQGDKHLKILVEIDKELAQRKLFESLNLSFTGNDLVELASNSGWFKRALPENFKQLLIKLAVKNPIIFQKIVDDDNNAFLEKNLPDTAFKDFKRNSPVAEDLKFGLQAVQSLFVGKTINFIPTVAVLIEENDDLKDHFAKNKAFAVKDLEFASTREYVWKLKNDKNDKLTIFSDVVRKAPNLVKTDLGNQKQATLVGASTLLNIDRFSDLLQVAAEGQRFISIVIDSASAEGQALLQAKLVIQDKGGTATTRSLANYFCIIDLNQQPIKVAGVSTYSLFEGLQQNRVYSPVEIEQHLDSIRGLVQAAKDLLLEKITENMLL